MRKESDLLLSQKNKSFINMEVDLTQVNSLPSEMSEKCTSKVLFTGGIVSQKNDASPTSARKVASPLWNGGIVS